MIGTDIAWAAALLREGKLVAIPTETVYGLAGNAFSLEAVSEIFAVKERPVFDPLIVHTADIGRLQELALSVPAAALRLAERFMPGPLTLLLPKAPIIPDLVTAGSPWVALRVPQHEMALSLLRALDFPLAAPSANPFGYISPTTARHVEEQLGEKIPYILDGGPCQVGLESTIVGFPEGALPVVYRKGGLGIEAIEAVIGEVAVQAHSSSNPLAPGMLKSHYAPRTPLLLGDIPALLQQYPGRRVGVLAFREGMPDVPESRQQVLAPSGDFGEAARHLFAAMRYLDALGLECIVAELLPEQGLGRAINDRLRRAAAGK
ncbi:MAG: L-threonylcarbamoyladenylate synthase [Saprospiraceae bacterium]|jgi:L-threonylcarbamoyladenylate synthase